MKSLGLNTGMGVLIMSLFILATIVSSCNNDDENPLNGRLSVLLTDRPFSFDMVADATVTITKIELRKERPDQTDNENGSEEAGGKDENGSPYQSVWEGEEVYHLTDLQNGVTEEIAEIELPAGSYDLVRVYINDASIELMNGNVYDLKIPSAAVSGLKIFIDPALVIEGGLSAELLLDFDLSRSLIAKGPMEDLRGFNFKPVIRAVNNSTTGRIGGLVTDDSSDDPLGDVEVWIEAADTVVTSTLSEEDGFYALIGIPEGLYTLYADKEGYELWQADDKQVIAGNQSTVDIALTPVE